MDLGLKQFSVISYYIVIYYAKNDFELLIGNHHYNHYYTVQYMPGLAVTSDSSAPASAVPPAQGNTVVHISIKCYIHC